MGAYLSHQGNRKASQSEGTRPDENFAREVMQLFTIGLYELNLDSSPNRDGNLNTYPDSGSDLVPTYTQQDIEELAKVFTGWDLVGNKNMGAWSTQMVTSHKRWNSTQSSMKMKQTPTTRIRMGRSQFLERPLRSTQRTDLATQVASMQL